MNKEKLDPTWKDRVFEWQASGKSVKAWCLEKSIPITTFYGWKTRLKKLPSNESLVKLKEKKVEKEFIELKDQQSCDSWLILEYKGVKIHLKANFNQITLKQCLNCLRGVSC